MEQAHPDDGAPGFRSSLLIPTLLDEDDLTGVVPKAVHVLLALVQHLVVVLLSHAEELQQQKSDDRPRFKHGVCFVAVYLYVTRKI